MKALLILTVRNEGAFLIDWLAWHRHVGFTDFLVFSNDCTDGTDLMLDRLAAMGWLTHVPNPGPHEKGAQWAALKAANAHPLKRQADWLLTADIDEYVTVHAGDGRLADLFAALPEATAIPLTWRLFGNGGVIRRDGRPVPEVFTRAAPAVMGWPWRAAMFKTLFRNDGSYGALGVHRPKDPTPEGLSRQRWFDGSGRELPADFHSARLFSPFGQDNYGLVQLNHYALGAMEDYVLKCDRGRANRSASAFDLSYWVERNLCAVEDRALVDRFPAAGSLRDELRADPLLADLEKRAQTWRSNRLRQLMSEEAYRSLLGRLMMAPHSRLLSERESRFLFDLARQNQSGTLVGTGGSQETD
ncbi:glycosyltransferase family 2 protein [Frigidibacter sp. RF13]|uniref:glycosyltransferase family 2 protein n=1 Tax=Frigidibacter sp. RF13 TaxID=2997340 RepID=UPI00226FC50F|nr:glycosyltransferase family 2 protein [Frigidibacter sp. RF13]MCY1125835.1 glycosyltransferase family 2 protein [Frigidibacter sp. RF13]